MVWSVFLAFYVMYRYNLDISTTFIISRLSYNWQKGAAILSLLCGLLVSLVIVVEAPQILSRQVGQMEVVELPRYALSVPLILSSALLVVQFVVRIVGVLGNYESAVPPKEEDGMIW